MDKQTPINKSVYIDKKDLSTLAETARLYMFQNHNDEIFIGELGIMEMLRAYEQRFRKEAK
jgi:hypothetical protein